MLKGARRSVAVLAALLCSVAVCLLPVGTAWGAITHKYLSQITEVPASSGAAVPGPLTEVNAVAIDSGNLYVAETGTQAVATERLDEFNASSGAFVRQFSLPSSLQAFYYFGLAAGHSTGEEQVYAGAEDGELNDSVVVFDGEGHVLGSPWSGTPSGPFGPYAIRGIAADNRTSSLGWSVGDVYVSDGNRKVIDVFKPTAGNVNEEFVTQIEAPEEGVPFEPSLVAVSPLNGDVIVFEGAALDIFEPTAFATYVLVNRITGTPTGPFQYVNTYMGKPLTVDGNGDIYLAETENPAAVDEWGPAGNYLGRLAGTPTRSFYRLHGIAADPATGNVYVGDAENFETEAPGTVDVFGPNLVVPDITTAPASNVTPTGATLNGTVNPDNAGEATCKFAWGTSVELDNTTSCEAAIPNGEAPQPVQGALSGLSPDTTYIYRLQASNASGLNQGEPYEDQQFHTPGPGIHEEWSTSQSSSSVTLNAKIDPNGAPTTYYFQYGTDASYGSFAPATPGASIGAGEGDVVVNQHLQGVSAATTYHYRVVAISELAGGETVEFAGADETFTTQPLASGFKLLDGRAWEMVSPPNKHGSELEPLMQHFGSYMQASVNGGAVTYTANGPTEEEPQGSRSLEPTQLLSMRTAQGWATKDITTRFEQVGKYFPGGGPEYQLFSSDLSMAALSTETYETKLSSEATERTPYLRRNDTCEPSPSVCYVPLVTPADVEPQGLKWGGSEQFVSLVTGSPDLSHVIIKSEGVQLLPAGAETNDGVYEWSKGTLQLVTELPGGIPAPKGGKVGLDEASMRHAVSDDGSHVVFEAESAEGAGPVHLYTRDMVSGETQQIDVVQSGAKGGEGNPRFQTASSDGSKVFFTDSSRLTPESTGVRDLYEYDVAAHRLTDLSVPLNHGEHAEVQGLVQGASEDGSYVYFVANGVLAPGATRGQCPRPGSTCNLYVYHSGVTMLIAALSSEDQQWIERLESTTARVSPNGRWLAFMSDRSLTGYDNRDANSGEPDEEVYIYHAPEDLSSGSGTLACASCNPTGSRPTGMFVAPSSFTAEATSGPLVDNNRLWNGRWLAALIPGWPLIRAETSVYQPHYLSNGGRLFFDSNEALVPADVNGAMDVYEYEPEGEGDCARGNPMFSKPSAGCVGLISSGGSAEESAFMDASENGNDVFFLTAAKLRPEDYDTALDLYDARVCTSSSPCLPVPAASPPPCSTGDSCKPAPSPQPTIFGAAPSATFSGVGNVAHVGAPTLAPRSLTRAQKLRRALQACARVRSKRRRHACVRRARKRYGARRDAKRSSAIARER